MQKIANEIRGLTLKCIASLGSGHIGGSFSIVDLLTVLYYKEMNIDPKNPTMEGRDRLVVSKGHAGPAVYATLAHRGYFPESELYTLNKIHTNLPSHCDMNKTIGIDMTTGSLGQGLSCGVGMALASRIKQDGSFTYVILGDGELQEGQNFEAMGFAGIQKLVYADKYQEKFESFGFDTVVIDGHNFDQIISSIERAKKTPGMPHAIIMNTIKGKGISFIENAKLGNHSMPITAEQLEMGLKELNLEDK